MRDTILGENQRDSTAENPDRLNAIGAIRAAVASHEKWLDSHGREGERFSAKPELLEKALEIPRIAEDTARDLFWNRNLAGADFSSVVGLLPEDFSGADLTRANLPVSFDDALKRIEELSKNGSKTLVGLLLAVAFVLLAAFKLKDADLFSSSGTASLPIINVEVPVRLFLGASPLLLVGAFAGLHMYLQKLWKTISTLPAVFPDGVAVDLKTYPWMLNDLVRVGFPRLRSSPSPQAWLRVSIFAATAYLLIPLAIFVLWARCLPKHDLLLTEWQGAALLAAEAWSMISAYLAWITVTRNIRLVSSYGKWRPPAGLPTWLASLACAGVVVASGIALLRLSRAAVLDGVTFDDSWMHISGRQVNSELVSRYVQSDVGIKDRPYEWLGFVPLGASLEDAKLSVTSPNWSDPGEDFIIPAEPDTNIQTDVKDPAVLILKKNARPMHEAWLDARDRNATKVSSLMAVNGASLRRADLHGANMRSAFVVHGDLRGANLNGADLREADFRMSQFQASGPIDPDRTNLANAECKRANFKGAHFDYANMVGCHLEGANMQGAALWNANLSGAFLIGAELDNAYLGGANLRDANLQGAYLAMANLKGANLQDAHLEGAHLRGANLSGAQLQGAHFDSADYADEAFLHTNFPVPAQFGGAQYDSKTEWKGFPFDEHPEMVNVDKTRQIQAAPLRLQGIKSLPR